MVEIVSSGEITKVMTVVSSGDNQDGGGCLLGKITKLVEDVHTERLLVTVFRFLHMVPSFKYSEDPLYTS